MQGILDAKNNPRDYGIEGKDDGMKEPYWGPSRQKSITIFLTE